MSDWIKCIERMPDDVKIVFVSDGITQEAMAFRADEIWYHANRRYYHRDANPSDRTWAKLPIVTHWQPLPDPPEDAE